MTTDTTNASELLPLVIPPMPKAKKPRKPSTRKPKQPKNAAPTVSAEEAENTVILSRMAQVEYNRAVGLLVKETSRHDFVFCEQPVKNTEVYLEMTFKAKNGLIPVLVETENGEDKIAYVTAGEANMDTRLVLDISVLVLSDVALQNTIGWTAKREIKPTRPVKFLAARRSNGQIWVGKADDSGKIIEINIPKRLSSEAIAPSSLSRLVALKFDAFFDRAKNKVGNVDGRKVELRGGKTTLAHTYYTIQRPAEIELRKKERNAAEIELPAELADKA